MPAILFVEDDATIAMGVEYSLKQDGFEVVLAPRLEEARELLKRRPFDLVLLDLGLPPGGTSGANDTDGLTVLRELRARQDTTPVIVLTARDGPRDRVTGLDSGADDYLVKPFDVGELKARLRALLRSRRPVFGTARR